MLKNVKKWIDKNLDDKEILSITRSMQSIGTSTGYIVDCAIKFKMIEKMVKKSKDLTDIERYELILTVFYNDDGVEKDEIQR